MKVVGRKILKGLCFLTEPGAKCLIVLAGLTLAFSGCSLPIWGAPLEGIKEGIVETSRPPKVVDRRGGEVLFISPISTGRQDRALSVNARGETLQWNVAADTFEKLFRITNRIDKVAFSPRAQMLAVSQGRVVSVFSIPEKKKLYSMDRVRGKVTSLGFQPNGEGLIIGAADGNLYRWKFLQESQTTVLDEKAKSFERYTGHSSVVSSVAMHPGGRVIFSGDWSGNLRAWKAYDADPVKAKYEENLFGPKFFADKALFVEKKSSSDDGIERIRVSEDGEFLFVALHSGALELWEVRGFVRRAVVAAHRGLIYDLAISQDGKRLATVGRDGFVRFWKVAEQGGDDRSISTAKVLSFSKERETSLPPARTLAFEGDAVLAGATDGRVFHIS